MNKHTDFDQAELARVGAVCDRSSIARSVGSRERLAVNKLLWVLFLLGVFQAGALAQVSDSSGSARESIQTVDRAFGLQLGDLVTRSVRASGNAGQFAPDKLPEPGPISAWVNLLSIEIDERADQAGDATWLTLTYQITGAAPTVTLVYLPVLQLLGAAEKEPPVLARLDAMPVSVSPIMGEHPFQRTGLGDLQPDALVQVVPSSAWQQLMWIMAALATLLTALLLGRLWWRQRPDQQTPFVQASISLKTERALGLAYQHLHRAFDRTARQSMMLDDIPAFVESNPAYKKMQAQIDEFFAASRNQFFKKSSFPNAGEMDDSHDAEIETLRTVANKLARIEKELL